MTTDGLHSSGIILSAFFKRFIVNKFFSNLSHLFAYSTLLSSYKQTWTLTTST